jgi:hypothetical protein
MVINKVRDNNAPLYGELLNNSSRSYSILRSWRVLKGIEKQ